MGKTGVQQEIFMLDSDGLKLRVFLAIPESGPEPFPSIQIHHFVNSGMNNQQRNRALFECIRDR
jgi:hypothetical protein